MAPAPGCLILANLPGAFAGVSTGRIGRGWKAGGWKLVTVGEWYSKFAGVKLREAPPRAICACGVWPGVWPIWWVGGRAIA